MNKPKVVYEDDFLLVLDKPAGWVVNRAQTTRGRVTIQDWLSPVSGDQEDSDFVKRRGIVHRLDKETSGLLVVAREERVFKNLQRQFKERRVRKKYLCLAHGVLKPEKGKIIAPVARHPGDRKKFGVFFQGRESETRYKVKEYFKDKLSLVEVYPKTGRTHQIRIHLKFIGHPVVGDLTYAGRKTARADRVWCPRQFLHAFYLKFVHPESKKTMEFKTGLPDDLREALEKLRRGKSFVCKNCSRKVLPIKYGGRFRNHCPNCLYSLHLDLRKAGDRKNKCGGVMEPVGFFKRRTGEQVIVHRCLKCDKEVFNRIASDDDFEKVNALPEVKARKGRLRR